LQGNGEKLLRYFVLEQPRQDRPEPKKPNRGRTLFTYVLFEYPFASVSRSHPSSVSLDVVEENSVGKGRWRPQREHIILQNPLAETANSEEQR
jgi:hypothetical protein